MAVTGLLMVIFNTKMSPSMIKLRHTDRNFSNVANDAHSFLSILFIFFLK